MSQRRGAYAPEFRRQIVELVGLGRKPKDLAAEFGCHITSIQDWVRQAKIDVQGEIGVGPLTTAEREELAKLEGRPGIVQKPRKNNLAYCSETENEARAGFHRPALIN